MSHRTKSATTSPPSRRNVPNIGIDITRDLVPVVPAAHYFCGGIWVDEWGQTSLPQSLRRGRSLLHGRPRGQPARQHLAAGGLVWGERAAHHIHAQLEDDKLPMPDGRRYRALAGYEPRDADPALISQDMSFIKNIMWNYVGLVRTARRLERAHQALYELEHRNRAVLSPHAPERRTDRPAQRGPPPKSSPMRPGRTNAAWAVTSAPTAHRHSRQGVNK